MTPPPYPSRSEIMEIHAVMRPSLGVYDRIDMNLYQRMASTRKDKELIDKCTAVHYSGFGVFQGKKSIIIHSIMWRFSRA